MTRSTIDLTPDQVARLNAIAEITNSRARSGPTHGKPSWRVFVKDIADGRIRVCGLRKRMGYNALP